MRTEHRGEEKREKTHDRKTRRNLAATGQGGSDTTAQTPRLHFNDRNVFLHPGDDKGAPEWRLLMRNS